MTKEQKDKLKELENNVTFDTIPIKVYIIKDEDYVVMSVYDENLKGLSSCIVQEKTVEEAKEKLIQLIGCLLEFYEEESRDLAKLAIFRGNKSKSQFWFTIIGIGLTFYWEPKNLSFKRINLPESFWIGRLRITFTNEWKRNRNVEEKPKSNDYNN